MEKKKLAVIFGGMSTEHDVSIVSGISIIKNLNREKYEIFPIYINEQGIWYTYNEPIEQIKQMQVGDTVENIQEIKDIMTYIKQMDCIFPVLHGLYGEDGTIQGLFELLKIPYVGCKVLASSISMDKAYTKMIFDKAGLKQAPYVYIRADKEQYRYVDESLDETIMNLKEVVQNVSKQLTYPMFVKPSNSGSSVGITKVNSDKELEDAIIFAKQYDRKIIIEQGICAREVECAVLGNEEVMASCVGEILSAEEFYSFDSKYKNAESMTVIPTDLPEEISEKIRKQAKKAFKAVDGKGLSRVDFFVDKNTNEILINEINTLPGFTSISMYPKLFEASGISYAELLDKLVELAM